MKKIKLDKGEAEIISTNCVNSRHKASFLAEENDDDCQCSFGECKVKVAIAYNGHDPYTYILNEQEISTLPTEKTVQEMPQMEGTLKALDNLTIKN